MLRLGHSFIALMFYMYTPVYAEQPKLTVTAFENNNDIPDNTDIISVPLSGRTSKKCYKADSTQVHEIGDGSVYYQPFDKLFDDVALVFGADQRYIRDVVVQEDWWTLCVEFEMNYNQHGEPEPILRRGYFIPPDTSS